MRGRAQVTAEEVTSCNPTSVDLRPEMVVVHDSKINYANKARGVAPPVQPAARAPSPVSTNTVRPAAGQGSREPDAFLQVLGPEPQFQHVAQARVVPGAHTIPGAHCARVQSKLRQGSVPRHLGTPRWPLPQGSSRAQRGPLTHFRCPGGVSRVLAPRGPGSEPDAGADVQGARAGGGGRRGGVGGGSSVRACAGWCRGG